MAHQRSLAVKLRIIEDGGDCKHDMNQAIKIVDMMVHIQRSERDKDSAKYHDLKRGIYVA
ncbi:hypothetical protein A3197_16385 [Candidatus Thiodiazotropha endoloripes]|nr:hypothetical protein A3197_16385 [Candidatus Thiodiazotropha endoloripes]